MIAFLRTFEGMIAQLLPKLIEIHRQTRLPGLLVVRFSHTAREQFADLRDVLHGQIGAVHLQLFHTYPFTHS